jgi:hypothetical protein
MEDQPHATALTKNEIIRSGLKQGWLAPGVEDSGKPQGWWLPRGSVLVRLNHLSHHNLLSYRTNIAMAAAT